MTRLAALILALMIMLLLPITAGADGSGECTFTGTVTADNAQVTEGTLITAIIAGDEYYTHTSTVLGYSTYTITILAPDGKTYADGTKVTFRVNGHDTTQSATFKGGASLRLNLTDSPSSTPSASYVAIVAGSVVGFLALVAAAYYILSRRRSIKIAAWSMLKARMPSKQSIPASAEVEPVYNRYAWDSAKLAWVENATQVAGQPSIKQFVISSARISVGRPTKAPMSKQMEQGTSIALDSQNKYVVQERTSAATVEESPVNLDVYRLYSGDVKISVTSPAGLRQLRTFSTNLSRLKKNHIITIRVAKVISRQSAVFELFLHQPVPLTKILRSLPDVDIVSDESRLTPIEVRLIG